MDGPGLSGRELRILTEIENHLQADRHLDRALRTMRHGPRWLAGRLLRTVARMPVFVFSVLGGLCAALLVISATAHSAAVLTGFSLVWASSVALGAARVVAHRRGIAP
ncbi:hypothetical protein ACIRVF_06550 [Kitasatospora sp. NPDC101157]|uniref:hypothetical protein n=1 Tax=Kitasatospora sp. NPDC101157 TaxID=3364098 RepID=UPI00381B2E98